ncbi:MAG TPA: non-homologous end-joining DNA ligase [Selenomonadales bacterium]|nr:non-homologous end-joining DNA ligase [Selenomonadales bacterium]
MAKQPMPEKLPPMLAKTGRMPADASAYGFEIKWDGIRAIACLDRGRFRLLSRNQKELASQYPELSALAEALPDRRIMVDGEIVTLGENGRPSFSRLQHRMGLRSPQTIARMTRQIPATYIIFDLLYLDDRLLIDLPYTERRRLLADLALSGPSWQTPVHQSGDGPALQRASRAIGLEGLVAKRLDSLYEPGKRTGAWLKIKNQRRQELVIAGWVPGRGNRSGTIGALLVGYYDLSPEEAAGAGGTQQLRYAGKVGTGFTRESLARLEQRLDPLVQAENPFSPDPRVPGARFVRPELVGEFEFTEWTPNHTLRHPSFKGLRDDKPARQVRREPDGQ